MHSLFGRLNAALLLSFALALFSIGEVTAQTPQSPHLLWNYALTDGAAYGLGMSDDGGDLIAVIGFGFDPGGQIVSLDPATGAVRWLVETAEAPSADPVVQDGVVYAGIGSLVGGGAAVYALDAETGSIRWRTAIERGDLPATPIDAVTLNDGTLFVNRGDATLLALDAATGNVQWEFDLQKPSRGAPIIEGDTVYVSTGFDGGRIFAIDAANVDVRWSVEDRENPVTGPVLAGGYLYVPFTSGDMVAYDPATGEERWRTMAGVRDEAGDMNPRPGLPLLADGVLFTSSNGFAGAHTVALDATTGEQLWSVPTGDFSAGAPSLYEGALLVGSDSGELLALDPATGAEFWRIVIPNDIDNDLNQASPPLAAGERIFVRERAGGVVALGSTS